MTMNKEIAAKNLEKFFGESTIKLIAPKKFLAFVENVLIEQYEKIVEAIINKEAININPLVKELHENNNILMKLLEKEIKIPEQKDILIPEFPKEFNIKKPHWYKPFETDKFLEIIKKIIQETEFKKEELSIGFYLNNDGVVVKGKTGMVIKLYAIKLNATGDVSVNWRNGNLDLEGNQDYIRLGGYTESVNPPHYLFKTSPGNDLNLAVLAKEGGMASGRVSYWFDNE